MNNISKIQKISHNFHLLLSILLVGIPLYYIVFWTFINYLPETLITVNSPSKPILPHNLPIKLQVVGLVVCFLPLSALTYGLINVRRLFSFYKQGILFSFEQVIIFKKTAKALMLWVILSMVYESVKSVLFSLHNPPGTRVITVNFGSAELSMLMVAGITLVIAWIMDEGRILAEEKELTV